MKVQLGFTKEQLIVLAKASAYIAVSAVLSFLITETTDKPELFGALTPIVNVILVFLKQFVSAPKE